MRFNPRAVHVYTSLFIIRWRNNSKAVDDRDVLVYIIFPRSRGEGRTGPRRFIIVGENDLFFLFRQNEQTSRPSSRTPKHVIINTFFYVSEPYRRYINIIIGERIVRYYNVYITENYDIIIIEKTTSRLIFRFFPNRVSSLRIPRVYTNVSDECSKTY